MTRRWKAYAVALGSAAAIAGLFDATYATPAFMALASPGVMFGLMAAGNTPNNNDGLIFFGNFFVYGVLSLVIAEIFLAVQRRRNR